MSKPVVSAQERIESLSPQQRELVTLLLEQRARKAHSLQEYPRVAGLGGLRAPTSWAQQRLWFIDQLERGSAGYHIPVALRLHGPLRCEALEAALQALVQRHEALRTVFVVEDSVPVQEIAPHGSVLLRKIDLSDQDAVQREAAVRRHQIEEAHGKFDLRTGPLIRGRLLHLQAEEHVLLTTMHHIVSDGWSLSVFFRELAELYAAHAQGRSARLEPLPLQYADYAQWQQQWMQGEVLDRQLNYWRVRLQGATPQLELPTDRPRPAVQSYRGQNVPVVLNAGLSADLKRLAQRHQMTLFMILHAAWVMLLARLSGEEDIMVGTPVANRQRPELTGLIGFFVNTLVLRTSVRSDWSLPQLLEHVKEITLSAYDHQDLAFERLVEALQPERSLSRNPLFQVMFVLQNAPRAELRLPGLSVAQEQAVDEAAIVDLFMSLEECADEIVGSVSFASDLFDATTVERWVKSFEVLLRGMTDDAGRSIGELRLLPDEELRLIESFNATDSEQLPDRLVHQLVEEQAERTPHVPAVIHGEQSATYWQLNARANQLARHLQQQGVGAGTLVGICVERSIDMAIAVLATLKAGAAYVPLDPSYPAERLRYMVEDAAPALVLTHTGLRGALPVASAEVLALDAKWSELAALPIDNLVRPEQQSSARSPVYVIYTSGSTGRPKGTTMPHRAAVNLIEWHRAELPLRAGQRVLQFAALSFDVAFQEVFSTLSLGGTLVLVDDWVRRDARALSEFLSRQAIERLFVPPLMLESLAECFHSAGAALPQSLGDLITAGEQLRVGHEVVSYFRQLGGCRLHNHYGPTETHVVTALTLGGEPDAWPLLPAIGRPIANTQIHVLDARRQRVPIGVPGEIYIGGTGVALGYLRRPELTALRFVPNPFSDDVQARLYKTGDLGRWRPDGTLEYIGRNDDQVKIRGYRIELGEIEAQLALHQQVKEAAVVARQEAPGEKQLVAYITRRDGDIGQADELRAYLKAVLPEHMVPSAFVTMERLPLTPSGKLDRRALPAPQLDAYAVSERYEAPQGDIEETVAGIWRMLLKVERVGRDENFFALGGHSLLATRVMTHISHVLDVDLPLRALFEKPTVAGLSSCIVQEIATEVSTEA